MCNVGLSGTRILCVAYLYMMYIASLFSYILAPLFGVDAKRTPYMHDSTGWNDRVSNDPKYRRYTGSGCYGGMSVSNMTSIPICLPHCGVVNDPCPVLLPLPPARRRMHD